MPAVSRKRFEVNIKPKVGIEMELFIREDDIRIPAGNATAELIKAVSDESVERCDTEVLVDMCEVKTEPYSNMEHLDRDLRSTLQILERSATARRLRLLPISLEPFTREANLNWLCPASARMIQQVYSPGIWSRNAICGTQVSVEVSDGNALLFVHKALRRCLHLLLGLTANSPFMYGKPAGMLAARPSIKASLPDGAWTAEEIHETSWPTYIQHRMKLVENLNQVLPNPWFHNLLLRLRPDRQCIEVCVLETVPSIDLTMAMADLVRRLVVRFEVAYKENEKLPDFLGPDCQLALQKSMQSIVLFGLKGNVVDSNFKSPFGLDVTHEMIRYAGRIPDFGMPRCEMEAILYKALRIGAPAQSIMSEFGRRHDYKDPCACDCPHCSQTVAELCVEISADFHDQCKTVDA